MPYPDPPGILRLKTSNEKVFFAGSVHGHNYEVSFGLCAAMVTTWLANLLCGGDPFGDAAMATPKVMKDLQRYAMEKPDGRKPFDAQDNTEFYYFTPAGLWTTGIRKGTLSAKALSDYMQTLIPMETAVWGKVWALQGGSHAFGLHGDRKRLLFFEPNFGVYELSMAEWRGELPFWMQNRYHGHRGYRNMDMYPVELIEATNRRRNH